MKRHTLRLTPAEAKAIYSLLCFAWADFDAMSDADCKTYGFDSRWLAAADRGNAKIRVMMQPQKRRGKAMLKGFDHRRANIAAANNP